MDRPRDLDAQTYLTVETDLQADLQYVGIPSRPTGYIWCAQEPLNSTWSRFIGCVIAQQSVNSPDPREDTEIIRLLLEDLEFSD